jgi:hypothetical protein
MNISTITMDTDKAREAWQNYRKAVQRRHTVEEAILMRGYKHLAKGKQVLDLLDVMKTVGVDSQGRPKLAIARASWAKVFFWGSFNGNGRFSESGWVSANATRKQVLLVAGTFLFRRNFCRMAQSRIITFCGTPSGSQKSFRVIRSC